LWIL